MRPDCNALIGEEIHVAANLVIFYSIYDAIDVNLVLDEINLMFCFAHMQVCHVVLFDAEIIELVQRVLILYLLIVNVILRTTIINRSRLDGIIVLFIRYGHVGIGKITRRAPAGNAD